MAAALVPLGDDDIGATLGAAAGVANVAYHRYYLHTAAVHLGRVGGGVPQTRGEHRHALLVDRLYLLGQAGHPLRQKQVHGERLIGHILHLADLFAQSIGCEHGPAYHAQAAGVGHRRRQIGHGHAPHAGLDDGVFDPQGLRQGCSEHRCLLVLASLYGAIAVSLPSSTCISTFSPAARGRNSPSR